MHAEGTARHVDSGGYRYWFGVLARMANIQGSEAETSAGQEQAARTTPPGPRKASDALYAGCGGAPVIY